MKLKGVQIEEFKAKLSAELLSDVERSIGRLEDLQSEFLHGRAPRDLNDVTESNIPLLLQKYKDLATSLKAWAQSGHISNDTVAPMSLFDVEINDDKKVATLFVVPIEDFPAESIKVDGFEKDRLPFRKSYNIQGFPVLMVSTKNDFMGLKPMQVAQMHREQNKSAQWVKGLGGDKGQFIFNGELKVATVRHIYA